MSSRNVQSQIYRSPLSCRTTWPNFLPVLIERRFFDGNAVSLLRHRTRRVAPSQHYRPDTSVKSATWAGMLQQAGENGPTSWSRYSHEGNHAGGADSLRAIRRGPTRTATHAKVSR